MEISGGLEPPLESPLSYQGALADYQGPSERDPQNPQGKLPPVSKVRNRGGNIYKLRCQKKKN